MSSAERRKKKKTKQALFNNSGRWHQDTKSIRQLFQRAVQNQHFIRVAAIVFLGGKSGFSPFRIIAREGLVALESQRLDKGYGLPRGKMSFAQLREVIAAPGKLLSVAFKTVTDELWQEARLDAASITYLGPGPIWLNEVDPPYVVDHYPEWKFKELGYAVPTKGGHMYRNERCYPVHCSACIYLVCTAAADGFGSREHHLATTEGRRTGTIDLRSPRWLRLFRPRQRRVLRLYRRFVRSCPKIKLDRVFDRTNKKPPKAKA